MWTAFITSRPPVYGVVTAAIAQLGERQTEDLEVPGSIPGLGISCPSDCLPKFGFSVWVFIWQGPRGLMDKASVFGTEDCRFESYRGQY